MPKNAGCIQPNNSRFWKFICLIDQWGEHRYNPVLLVRKNLHATINPSAGGRLAGSLTMWRMKMTSTAVRERLSEFYGVKKGRRKLHAYIGRSPDGARRVFAQDQDPARAMADAFDAARDYLKDRPDRGPLALWSFTRATDADMKAVTFARDC